MVYKGQQIEMKKLFLCIFTLFFAVAVNAQSQKTTTAVPISNGCGSESSRASRVLANKAKKVDAVITGSGVKKQNESCDQHDKDYYNGVNKEKADKDFQRRSPVMGTAVIQAKETSGRSYQEAQKDRQTSQQLQPKWEKENQQCLDGENYRVTSTGK
jgi:hypothetical protein